MDFFTKWLYNYFKRMLHFVFSSIFADREQQKAFFPPLASSNVTQHLYDCLFSEGPPSSSLAPVYISIFAMHATLPSLNISPGVSLYISSVLYILYLNATLPRGPLLLITGPHRPHYVISLMSSRPYDLSPCTVGMRGSSAPN